jgi:hypothetical protein
VFRFESENTEQGTWTRRNNTPDEMSPRQQAVGFALTIGAKTYGYVGTGYGYDPTKGLGEWVTYNDFWRYDPADDSWTEIAEPYIYDENGDPTDSLSNRRGAVAFTLSFGGKEYGFVGLGYEDGDERNYLNDFWRYDPENDTWKRVDGFGGNKRAGAMVFVLDNKVYICGGDRGTLVFDFYVGTPTADGLSFEKLREMRRADPNADYDNDYGMAGPLGRSFGVAFVVEEKDANGSGNGRKIAHIVGSGGTTGGVMGNAGASLWEYDHHSDLWFQRTNFTSKDTSSTRAGMIAFSFPTTGRAFVGLGFSGMNLWWDEMWEFFPTEDDKPYTSY